MKQLIASFSLFFTLLLSTNALAFEGALSSTTADPGETVEISVNYTNAGGITDALAGIDTVVTFDSNVLTFDSAVAGADTAQLTNVTALVDSNNANRLIVVQFGTLPVSTNGNGESLKLRFTVKANAPGGDTPLGFELYDFSDTTTTSATSRTDGKITITGGSVNRPPVLAAIGDKSVQVGANLNFTISATDPDGNTLTYSAQNTPTGAVFNPTTRIFNWTPSINDIGTHDVIFNVNDGAGGTDSETITITVTEAVNNPPVLQTIGNKSVQAGNNLSFPINAIDPDAGDVLTYSAENTPTGAAFNPTTRTFSWTPTAAQIGTHDITFSVTDGKDTDFEIVTVTVTSEPNNPPELATIGNKNVQAENNLNFTISATDLDGDPLTYSADNAPSGADFNPNTRTFNWTPTSNQAGTHQVTFSVTDGQDTDSETITITVTSQQNRAPVLAGIGNKNVAADSSLNFTISATDPDGDTLSYSANGIPSGADFNSSTRTFSWTPSSNQIGTHDVTFNVSDGELTDSETITITVTGAGGNLPPILEPIGDKTAKAGQTLFFTIKATDPDGNVVIYGSNNLPEGAVLNIFGAFSWQPTDDQVGIHEITLIAGDIEGGTDEETITITVIERDGNLPPLFEPIGNQVITIGERLTFTVKANDPEGSTVLYGAQMPQGAVVNSFSGFFSWRPTFDQEGVHEVTFVASDINGGSSSQTITITVNGLNSPPVLNNIPNKTARVGDNVNFVVSATDDDGDVLTYSAQNLPSGAEFNAQSNLFRWFPTASQIGTHNVTFNVSDGNGGTDAQIVSITVEAVPQQAPVLAPIGNRSVNANQNMSFTISATDPNGDTLTYSAQNLPPGAEFTQSNKMFRWVPTNAHAGNHSVTFTVSDGQLTDSETITITVNPGAEASQITSPSPGTTLSSSPVTFSWTSTSGVQKYWFAIGTTPGGTDIYSQSAGLQIQATVEIPLNGNPVYAQVWTLMNGVWETEGTIQYNTEVVSQITSPEPGSTLNSSPVTFNWKQKNNAAQYWFAIGTTPGGTDIYSQSAGLQTQATVEIPLNGSPVYAQVWSFVNQDWLSDGAVQYNTENNPQITSPEPGSTLNSSPVTFSWKQKNNAAQYWFAIGTTPGGTDIYSQSAGLQTQATVEIPLNGNPVYAQVWSFVNQDWQTDGAVRYETSTAQGFTNNLSNVPAISSKGLELEPVEDVQASFAAQEETITEDELIKQYSATAAAQMILDYLWWNADVNPEGPATDAEKVHNDQLALFDFGQVENYAVNQTLDRLDAQGLWTVLQNLDPAYTPYNYDWIIASRTSKREALSDIANLLATEIGQGEGHPVYVPAAVPVGGSYDNWVVVTGVRATDNPSAAAEYGIHGFWIMNPHVTGLGQQAYVTAEEFAANYVAPLTDVTLNDPNRGRYVSLIDSGTLGGYGTVVEQTAQLSYAVEDSEELIRAATDRVTGEVVAYDERLAELLKDVEVNLPLFVKSQTGDYYIVSFTPSDEAVDQNGVIAVAIIDASAGKLREITWTQGPVNYLPVKSADALQIVADHLGVNNINGAEAELINTGEVYYPSWRVSFNGETHIVDHNHNVTTEENSE